MKSGMMMAVLVAGLAVGGVGVWWAGRCPDYELVLVADSGLHQVKARFDGVATKFISGGQTAYCNGSKRARAVEKVRIR